MGGRFFWQYIMSRVYFIFVFRVQKIFVRPPFFTKPTFFLLNRRKQTEYDFSFSRKVYRAEIIVT